MPPALITSQSLSAVASNQVVSAAFSSIELLLEVFERSAKNTVWIDGTDAKVRPGIL